MVIYTASKLQRLMWLIRKYSTLASPIVTCSQCNKKMDQKELLNHHQEEHNYWA